jgi:hypothetical protein
VHLNCIVLAAGEAGGANASKRSSLIMQIKCVKAYQGFILPSLANDPNHPL